MASGHVNRTNRPNTWLHRPACGREESPCQPGAVHTWHFATLSHPVIYVRFQSEPDIRAIGGYPARRRVSKSRRDKYAISFRAKIAPRNSSGGPSRPSDINGVAT